jgi:serine/threonine-protein kinase HipA
MGRKRKERVLDVYVGTSCVGTYTRAPSGATAFRYTPDWLGSDKAFPISLSMPLSDKAWTGDSANAYFDGLLPDDQKMRETIAAREHADSAGTFELLASIGRDCVGAPPHRR